MLESIDMVQVGNTRAASVCGRLFADLGARVTLVPLSDGDDESGSAVPRSALLDTWLARGKQLVAPVSDPTDLVERMRGADLVVVSAAPSRLAELGLTPRALETLSLSAAVVYLTPFGLDGPRADDPASDLTLLCASGIAKLLTGQVDDLSEAPVRAVGDQSAFIGGLAAACAGMHLLLLPAAEGGGGLRWLDVSIQESLATLDVQELTRVGHGRGERSRRRVGDGNGATVTILPCADGYVAISPREPHQWQRWLGVMGDPAWGAEARFAQKSDRAEHFDALHALMSEWSRSRDKHEIARAAQSAHVPCFALGTPAEQLESTQLRERRFFVAGNLDDRALQLPGLPFGLSLRKPPGARAPTRVDEAPGLPLSGVRVLDFSWVIAGPTTTRYLAAFGAEVIKVEAPGRGDPGRASELHTVLGQGKRAITLDLKTPAGLEVARSLVQHSDVLIENFATGVMQRLGLDESVLHELNPHLIYLSASGLGRSGPQARAVAYGTLLQCYSGFAALNGHPDRPPRVGMAWLDPMCALMLAFMVAAGLWRRRRDAGVTRIDFSMVEAMLWTMAAPLLACQGGEQPRPCGNRSSRFVPHGVYRVTGEDAWVSMAIRHDADWRRLCALVPGLEGLHELDTQARRGRELEIDQILGGWFAEQSAPAAHQRLLAAGIAAAPVAGAAELLACAHLRERGFWRAGAAGGELPGFPWRGSVEPHSAPAPALGADNEWVAREILGLDEARYRALCEAGAFG